MASAPEIWRSNAFTYAMTGLIFYEFCITLDQEVSIIWRKGSQASKWLFAINRYSTLLYALLVITPTGTLAPPSLSNKHSLNSLSCRPLLVVTNVLLVVQLAIFSAFTLLRSYALSGRNLPLSYAVLAIGLIPLAISTFSYANDRIVVESGCTSINLTPIWLQLRLVLVSQITMFLLSVAALGVTWWSTWSLYVDAKAAHMKSPLATLLIRDGTFYFGCLSLLHICGILNVFLGGDAWFDYFGPAWIARLHNSIVCLLIPRFLLNLRQVVHQDRAPSRVSRFSFVAFHIPESIMGNIGEPLEYESTAREADDNTYEF